MFAGVIIDISCHLQGQPVVLVDLPGYDGSGITGPYNEALFTGRTFFAAQEYFIPKDSPVYAQAADEKEYQPPGDDKYTAGQIRQG